MAVVGERDPQDGRPPAAQRELDVQLVLARVRDLGVDRALGEAELLARDSPSVTRTKRSCDRALARPSGQPGEQGPAVPREVDAERPEPRLEAQGTSREHGHDRIFHETVRIPRGFTAGHTILAGPSQTSPLCREFCRS